MFTHGASRGRRRLPASSRSIPVVTIRRCLIKLIKTEGVTFTHGVPTILQMLLDAAAKADVDLAGLKMVIGGSALPKALAKQAMDRGVDVFAGYGMSETGPLLTVAHLQSSDLSGDPITRWEYAHRAGRACPLVDLRIVDADMKEAPHDGATSGEIVVRAPWLTNGYFNNPDASEQLWAGGYLHTNDIGVITPDGYLRVTDRIKDVIKTGGEWISSLQLEDIIMHRAGVGECAVIGVKDDAMGRKTARAHRARSEDGAARDRGGHQGPRALLQRKGRDLEIRRSAEDSVR